MNASVSSLTIENAKNMHIVLNVFFVLIICLSQPKKGEEKQEENHQIQIKIRNKSMNKILYIARMQLFSAEYIVPSH